MPSSERQGESDREGDARRTDRLGQQRRRWVWMLAVHFGLGKTFVTGACAHECDEQVTEWEKHITFPYFRGKEPE